MVKESVDLDQEMPLWCPEKYKVKVVPGNINDKN